MVKIVYELSGEGSGQSSRSKELALVKLNRNGEFAKSSKNSYYPFFYSNRFA